MRQKSKSRQITQALFVVLVFVTFGKFHQEALRAETLRAVAPLWEYLLEEEEPLSANQALVIYRSPDLWTTSFWINQGEGQVSLFAPVVYEGALVGLVDYVGKTQSKVRLITDRTLSLGVRVLRGSLAKETLLYPIDQLLFALQQQKVDTTKLEELKEELFVEEPSWFLAKGELRGASQGIGSVDSLELKGRGFNLEYKDQRSVARDLRTGWSDQDKKTIPIITEGDLLVTSGLDGLFPEGIPVGYVTYVAPLEEGDVFYEITAKPSVVSLDALRVVECLEPVGFDPKDRPPQIGAR